MDKEIKYLTEEELLAGKQGYILCPYIIDYGTPVLVEAPKKEGVDISEIDYLDAPTQTAG